MQHLKYLLSIFALVLLSPLVYSQDTLPKFSLRNVGNNRVIIGWVNNYTLVKQISIQRSFDSLGFYKTTLSVADPNAVQNGFADTKAPNDHMFYRLFVVLDKGDFFFTPAKRPVLDTAVVVKPKEPEIKKEEPPVPVATGFVPSPYVYTNKDGYVFINLPDAPRKKYHIKFFDEDGTLMFELKPITDTGLTLDKANFHHAGWFNFELYNDDKLIEKHKFYLAKMF
jgi:hypothetical protein